MIKVRIHPSKAITINEGNGQHCIGTVWVTMNADQIYLNSTDSLTPEKLHAIADCMTEYLKEQNLTPPSP